MGMKRSAAAVPAGLGLRPSLPSLTTRERVLLGLAVVVVIPTVALGRQLFALPSLIERGIALLVPGSDGGAAKKAPPAVASASAGPSVPLASLVNPLLAGVVPTPARASVGPQRQRRVTPVVRVGGSALAVSTGVAPAARPTPKAP